MTAETPPIDLEEFRAAMRASGIEEIVMPMLQLFAQEAPKGMGALSSAMESGDLDAVNRAAHSLKSSAGNVRAKTLADLLQQLENAAKGNDVPSVQRLFGSTKTAYDAALRHLADLGVSA